MPVAQCNCEIQEKPAFRVRAIPFRKSLQTHVLKLSPAPPHPAPIGPHPPRPAPPHLGAAGLKFPRRGRRTSEAASDWSSSGAWPPTFPGPAAAAASASPGGRAFGGAGAEGGGPGARRGSPAAQLRARRHRQQQQVQSAARGFSEISPSGPAGLQPVC